MVPWVVVNPTMGYTCFTSWEVGINTLYALTRREADPINCPYRTQLLCHELERFNTSVLDVTEVET